MSKDKHNKQQQNPQQNQEGQQGGRPQQQPQGQGQQKQQFGGDTQRNNKSGGNQQGGANKQGQQQGQSQGQRNPDVNIQVDEDRETHRWTVHPVVRSASESAKWLVECNSKNEAYNLKNDLVAGKVKPPTDAPQSYSTPRKHQNGKTMVYAKVA